MILRNIEDFEGVKVGGYNCNNIRYADDTVLIASNQEDLQRMINVVTRESTNMGLSIKQVTRFNYLGFTITSDGRCDEEIKKRIALPKQAFQKMSSILKNKVISISTKTRVLKCYVWSILLYGSES